MNAKGLVLYWAQKYLEKMDISYIINWKRDTALAKNFLSQMNDTKLVKDIIDYIFEQDLEFYDLSFILGYNINKWIQQVLRINEEQELMKEVAKDIGEQKRKNKSRETRVKTKTKTRRNS